MNGSSTAMAVSRGSGIIAPHWFLSSLTKNSSSIKVFRQGQQSPQQQYRRLHLLKKRITMSQGSPFFKKATVRAGATTGGTVVAVSSPDNSSAAPSVTSNHVGHQANKDTSMRKKSERVQFSWVHFIAGGTGGMVGAIVTSPLDVVKTRLQSSLYKNALSESAAASRTGVASVLGHVKDTFVLLGQIYSHEGPRALYKGLGPNLVGVIPARAINFAAYGNGKKYFTDLNHGNESTLVHLSSAAMAGVVTATATNPIWMIKTRMQLQSEGKLRIYRNSFHCAVEILKTEGIRGLYKGLTASLLGVTEGAIQWVIYEHLKRTFAERRIRLAQSSDAMGGDSSSIRRAKYLVGGKHIEEWVEYLGSAGAAKFVASAITYPHEVLRTRMRQTPKGNEAVKYTGLLQTFRLVLKEEGIVALYGGLTAHMLRVVPNAAIMFFCYEAILHQFG